MTAEDLSIKRGDPMDRDVYLEGKGRDRLGGEERILAENAL